MNRPRQICRWHIYAGREELETYAARSICRAAAQAIETRGRFIVVLAGGETPRGVYARLASMSSPWERWHVYFGDERCLPASDDGRNDRMARAAWLERVSIPSRQVHGIPAELGATNAAQRYAEALASIDSFDLVLLGLGEDGHTAGLFPGQEAHSAEPIIAVSNAPKPPAERVSLSASRLSRTRQAMFIVAGEAKRRAVAAWRHGESVPAAAITPPGGVDVLLDADAWPDRFA